MPPTTLNWYVKDTSNSREGMPLTRFELLSDTWSGTTMQILFGSEEQGGRQYYEVTGWTDLVHSNPYPDVVAGCPTLVHCAKVFAPAGETGYLIWGGNSGVRIGGHKGWGQAVIWVALEDVADLPALVRQVVTKEKGEEA